jgi:mRNA-degrading endonuclease RelE of RelBE toxin-antitoxin system
MAAYRIEFAEDARDDLTWYTAFEQKRITSEIRDQLTHQPSIPTRNRKGLRENPIASWELRADKYRVFNEVNDESQSVTVVAVGHKDHETLRIRVEKVEI